MTQPGESDIELCEPPAKPIGLIQVCPFDAHPYVAELLEPLPTFDSGEINWYSDQSVYVARPVHVYADSRRPVQWHRERVRVRDLCDIEQPPRPR